MDCHVSGFSCRWIVTSVACHVGGLPRQWFVTNSHHKQLCFSYHPSSSDECSCLFSAKIIAPRGRLVPTNTLLSPQLHSKLIKARTSENNADHKQSSSPSHVVRLSVLLFIKITLITNNPVVLLTSFVFPYYFLFPQSGHDPRLVLQPNHSGK